MYVYVCIRLGPNRNPSSKPKTCLQGISKYTFRMPPKKSERSNQFYLRPHPPLLPTPDFTKKQEKSPKPLILFYISIRLSVRHASIHLSMHLFASLFMSSSGRPRHCPSVRPSVLLSIHFSISASWTEKKKPKLAFSLTRRPVCLFIHSSI